MEEVKKDISQQEAPCDCASDKLDDVFSSVLTTPPTWALKTIGGGRLKGFTDINPQWRIIAMTKFYGPVGVGWKFKTERTWTEDGADGEKFVFAKVVVAVRVSESEWSEWVEGFGGSMLISKERGELYNQDEGYKMAITDALGTALKFFGVGSDVYCGKVDGVKVESGSKYASDEKRGTKVDMPPAEQLLEWLRNQDNPAKWYREIIFVEHGYSQELKDAAKKIMYPK